MYSRKNSHLAVMKALGLPAVRACVPSNVNAVPSVDGSAIRSGTRKALRQTHRQKTAASDDSSRVSITTGCRLNDLI